MENTVIIDIDTSKGIDFSAAIGIDDITADRFDALTDKAWDDSVGSNYAQFVKRSIELCGPKNVQELSLVMFYCGRMVQWHTQ